MRFTGLPWAVATRPALLLLLAVLAVATPGAKHPRFGGKLRVQIRQPAISFDPRSWKPGSPETGVNARIAALLFDRLVSLDRYGRFQPQLASEWSHDSSFRRWQFAIRPRVRFSDGSPLVSGHIEAALQPLLPDEVKVTAGNGSLAIQSPYALPDLLEILASGPFFVSLAAPDGKLLGTGPFLMAESSAAKSGRPARYLLQANEICWAGRPFLDSVEISAGVPALTRLLELQLGRADLVELAPELVRRAQQENLRIWASAPVTLYGLSFGEKRAAADDARREALALALDRNTMAGVLLQKQAQPAATLLPEWLSGYASLFTVETNLERARELRVALPNGAAPAILRVDAPGEVAGLLGERVAVNARQAGINLEVAGRAHPESDSPNPARLSVHLFAWRTGSLSPRLELQTMTRELRLAGKTGEALLVDDLEALYTREKSLLEEHAAVPLVVLPDYAGLSRNVRDWMPSPWGEWHLADVWLDQPEGDRAGAASAAKPSLGDKP